MKTEEAKENIVDAAILAGSSRGKMHLFLRDADAPPFGFGSLRLKLLRDFTKEVCSAVKNFTCLGDYA